MVTEFRGTQQLGVLRTGGRWMISARASIRPPTRMRLGEGYRDTLESGIMRQMSKQVKSVQEDESRRFQVRQWWPGRDAGRLWWQLLANAGVGAKGGVVVKGVFVFFLFCFVN